MRYWPTSVLQQDPRLHHTIVWELMCAAHGSQLSENAMMACNELAAHTPAPDTPLMILHTVDAPMRRVYKERPHPLDFKRLERGGFVSTEDTFGFVLDALH